MCMICQGRLAAKPCLQFGAVAGQAPSSCWKQNQMSLIFLAKLTSSRLTYSCCCGRATAKLLLAVGANAVAANAAGRTPLDVAISQSPRPLPLLRLLNEEERWRSYIAQPRCLACGWLEAMACSCGISRVRVFWG